MKKLILIFSILALLSSVSLFAEEDEHAPSMTLDEAKTVAQQSNKPILIKFVRSDCKYCNKSEVDFDSSQTIQNALSKVILLNFNLQDDYGKQLSEAYDIGKYLPLFILTDKNGDIMHRWDGYSGVDKFVNKLYRSLRDPVTIKERESSVANNPVVRDVNILASYYEDILDYKKAVHYWHQGLSMKDKYRQTYLMKLFENYANGSWNDVYPFDSVKAAIDILFNEPDFNQADLIKAIRMTSNVARKRNRTDEIKQYLIDGIDLTKNSPNPKFNRYAFLFGADYALFIKQDTVSAIKIRKNGFNIKEDHSGSIKDYYPFARYCYDREINLVEAKELLLVVTNRIDDGTYKAKVYSLLGKIAEHNGDRKEALKYVEQAMLNDPDNEYYPEQYTEI